MQLNESKSITAETSSERSTTRCNFEATDEKGRVIGYIIAQATVVFEKVGYLNKQTNKVEWLPIRKEKYADVSMFSYVPEGKYYTWCPQATRNGVSFGACQADRYCHTPEEREAAIAEYIKSAEARAMKKRKSQSELSK